MQKKHRVLNFRLRDQMSNIKRGNINYQEIYFLRINITCKQVLISIGSFEKSIEHMRKYSISHRDNVIDILVK